MLFRRNLRGFFAHSLIMQEVWRQYHMPTSISTTSVEAFFGEFSAATNKLSMQSNVSSDHAETILFFLKLRRVSGTYAALNTENFRGLNKEHNKILEGMLDIRERFHTNDESLVSAWTEACESHRKKIEADSDARRKMMTHPPRKRTRKQ